MYRPVHWPAVRVGITLPVKLLLLNWPTPLSWEWGISGSPFLRPIRCPVASALISITGLMDGGLFSSTYIAGFMRIPCYLVFWKCRWDLILLSRCCFYVGIQRSLKIILLLSPSSLNPLKNPYCTYSFVSLFFPNIVLCLVFSWSFKSEVC